MPHLPRILNKSNLNAFNELTKTWESLDYKLQFSNYIHMHDSFIKNHWVCIVGSLSPSYDTLPENMQKELQGLVNTILKTASDLSIHMALKN